MDLSSLSRREAILGAGTVFAAVGSTNVLGQLPNAGKMAQQDTEGSLSACSFNIRYNNPDDPYPWPSRLPRVAETIDQLDPDLLGVQEAQPEQFTDLKETITDYEWYGLGREGGDESEAVPIAWPTGRFKVQDKGVFWLSPTPDVSSVGWDADLPRISTWASLRDDKTNTDIWFCNTHFSHVGSKARLNSAEIIRQRAAKRAENGQMVIITGDLNTIPTSPPYHLLTGQTGAGKSPIVDGRRAAEPTSVYGPWGTFHGWTDEIQDRIDYVFTPKEATVTKYRTLGVRTGAYRSDHLPVIAYFEL